jgi:hypothetical protein
MSAYFPQPVKAGRGTSVHSAITNKSEQEIVVHVYWDPTARPLVTARRLRRMIVEYDLEQRRHHGRTDVFPGCLCMELLN